MPQATGSGLERASQALAALDEALRMLKTNAEAELARSSVSEYAQRLFLERTLVAFKKVSQEYDFLLDIASAADECQEINRRWTTIYQDAAGGNAIANGLIRLREQTLDAKMRLSLALASLAANRKLGSPGPHRPEENNHAAAATDRSGDSGSA